MGGKRKRLYTGKNIVFAEQTLDVDSPFVTEACGIFKKSIEKSLTVFEKTIEKIMESS